MMKTKVELLNSSVNVCKATIREYFKSRGTKEKYLLIYSDTSKEKLDKETEEFLFHNENIINMSYKSLAYTEFYTSVVKTLISSNELTGIIGLGGGSPIDFAKWFAYNVPQNLEVIAIPSMVSTNVFATNKVAVVHKEEKHTENGKLPDVVIYDEGYLTKSETHNIWGLVDVLSILTALKDWDLADERGVTPVNKEIYLESSNLLTESLVLLKECVIAKEQNAFINTEAIFNLVAKAGIITNVYGSGRPESGSEHIFASALETEIEVPHAIAVSLGIAIMSYIQYQFIDDYQSYKEIHTIFDKLEAIGILNFYKDIPWSVIRDVIKNLKPRTDKYTYVDEIDWDLLYSANLKRSLEKDYCFKFKED